MKRHRVGLLMGTVLLVASACGAATSSTNSGAASGPGGSAVAATGTADSAAWLRLPLIDARTGATFTLADFRGKPLYVENFATWCSNCRRQLGNVQQAAAAIGDKAEFVSLSVETDLSAAKIAEYAKKEKFDNQRFAVMTPEMLAAMQASFGTSALNPPATPHVFVTASGTVGQLITGFEEPATIQSTLTAAATN